MKKIKTKTRVFSFKELKRFFEILLEHINHDRMTTSAASLAYTTILAIVPLSTVIFSLLSAFPIFQEANQALKSILSNNLAPAASDTIELYLEQFISNTNKMTAFGIIGLVVTSLLLIRSIDGALNFIWRTEKKRSLIYNFTMYWTILSLGPLLIGASLAISSYLLSMHWFSSGVINYAFIKFIPFIISLIGFWLLYCIVPTERVSLKYSFIGALLAALLFDIGKKGFALYVTSFPSYQLIYGVLASIPLLLVWIYISWCIILFGAEFAVALTDFNRSKPKESHSESNQGVKDDRINSKG